MGWTIARLANFYFRLAKIPIQLCDDPQTWQNWEIGCFRMLNPTFSAVGISPREVCIERLPGECLWTHLKHGTLEPRMLEAAGREYRRAHSFWSAHFGGPWSHGDATLSNCLYDEEEDRIRLIDFEIVHDKSLSAAQRHADDLLVLLLDVAAIVSRRRWLPYAMCFLKAYGDAEALEALKARLTPPTGLARIWWKVRTNFRRRGKVAERLYQLRDALGTAVAGSSFGVALGCRKS
jgi:tRNA A-37 threonylcarbamoyl transferase component Bud32